MHLDRYGFASLVTPLRLGTYRTALPLNPPTSPALVAARNLAKDLFQAIDLSLA